MPLTLLPDTIAVTREAFLAQTPITALVSTRIRARFVGNELQIVLETVADGEYDDPHHGQARVQANCWAAGGSDTQTAEARLLARTVWSSARDLVGTYTAGKVITATPLIFISAPDPTTGRARFIVDIQVATAP